jgi:hypothetical protein
MRVEIKKVLSGYCVLNIHNDTMYAARGYKIFKSSDAGEHWELDGSVSDLRYGLIANCSRLLARLFRAEISEHLLLRNGKRLAIGKKGIFVAEHGEKIYKKTFALPRGTRPLNICEDKQGILYFGEYLSNPERDEIHIYRSSDGGKTWSVCHTFAKNSIRHVHGVFYDTFEDLIWFVTGDLDGECLIGNTKDGFRTVNIIKRGGQTYRTVQLLFYKDYIVYGTDTEYDRNYIYRINRKDYEEERLCTLQGSVLSSIGMKGYAAVATAVEPSKVNLDTFAHVWISENGMEWEEVLQYEKDFLNPKYFQYGRVKFPRNGIGENLLCFTGHALKGIDNKTVFCSLKE